MELTATNVHAVLLDCLFDFKEPHTNAKKCTGVQLSVGLNPIQLEKHRTDIFTMLTQLPDPFMESKGKGWTFLNACQNNKGEQWADMHATMDELLCLGLGIDKVKFQLPRELWDALPGGMPYFSVQDKVFEQAT